VLHHQFSINFLRCSLISRISGGSEATSPFGNYNVVRSMQAMTIMSLRPMAEWNLRRCCKLSTISPIKCLACKKEQCFFSSGFQVGTHCEKGFCEIMAIIGVSIG
jgi:hypothetical protein